MWIITRDGFVSLVEHNTDPDLVRVRARKREHLVDTFSLSDADVIDLGVGAPDYRWHAEIPRLNVAQAMYDAVCDLDYVSHVKESVSGDDNQMYAAMLTCWTALHRLQDPPVVDHDWWNQTPAMAYDEWEARNREHLTAETFADVRSEMGAEIVAKTDRLAEQMLADRDLPDMGDEVDGAVVYETELRQDIRDAITSVLGSLVDPSLIVAATDAVFEVTV